MNMNRPDLMFLLAGAITFGAHWKHESGYPEEGAKIIGATLALAVIASLANNTSFASPVRGFAGLALLATAIRHIPTLSEQKKTTSPRRSGGGSGF